MKQTYSNKCNYQTMRALVREIRSFLFKKTCEGIRFYKEKGKQFYVNFDCICNLCYNHFFEVKETHVDQIMPLASGGSNHENIYDCTRTVPGSLAQDAKGKRP